MSRGKYCWTSREFDDWCKKQADELRRLGFKHTGTETTTKLLHDNVLVPNQVNLSDMIKPIHFKDKKKFKKNPLFSEGLR